MAKKRSKKAARKAGNRPGDAVSLRGAVDAVTGWSDEARRSIWAPEFPQKEFDALIGFVKKALDKAATNSDTSGVPPSQNPNRERKSRAKGQRKPGGQPGHPGTTLQMVDSPDEIVMHYLDWAGLPPGIGILCLGDPERRQVFDYECRRIVIEHRCETASDILGRRYVAGAPGVKPSPTSYGDKISALLIELAVLQMLPLARESRLVKGLFHLTVSQATIVNMLMRIHALLEDVDPLIRRYILDAPVAHFDGTGCSIRGKLHFIHNASAGKYTYFYVSPKRGREAMCVRKYRDFGGELGAFARHLQREADCIVTFLKYEGVEPTSNAVERALRPYVCRRKVSFGQTSLHGEEDITRLLTLHETCRRNGRSTYAELKKAIECHARGKTPSLYWIRKAGMKCGARSPRNHAPSRLARPAVTT